ncbi:general transcription factor 3C polypeptide 2-like [Oncorhynchus tshawytscha]|uniref:general transcription factor 3C polypeptide 2-like n=1 Tax=Oncorhynchus tshawytscha TaxID=74940 RepID=UPI001C3E098D|nr:general transcription factor 3C polypeptide 2-like [Oncorhynchus tshawytscha]
MLAQDKGFVWNVKWCPGGAWELLTTNKAPHMPRLCLLAASTSGHITIDSLPQPNTLQDRRKHTAKGGARPALMICQVHGVITLKRGSLQANHDEKNNQVLSTDWLLASMMVQWPCGTTPLPSTPTTALSPMTTPPVPSASATHPEDI